MTDRCNTGRGNVATRTNVPRTLTLSPLRPLEWRRRQLKALQRMLLENEEAMLDALKKDLHRGRFVSMALELWDVVGEVC